VTARNSTAGVLSAQRAVPPPFLDVPSGRVTGVNLKLELDGRKYSGSPTLSLLLTVATYGSRSLSGPGQTVRASEASKSPRRPDRHLGARRGKNVREPTEKASRTLQNQVSLGATRVDSPARTCFWRCQRPKQGSSDIPTPYQTLAGLISARLRRRQTVHAPNRQSRRRRGPNHPRRGPAACGARSRQKRPCRDRHLYQ
jgi:hypothetical protein